MIRILWSETKRLLFWFPLVISFHNNNTSILNNLKESSFATKFLNSTIYYHIKVSFLPPFHKSKFSVLVIIFLFILFLNFNLLIIFFKGFIYFFIKRFCWLSLLFFLFGTSINLTISDDWYISSWTNIIWNWMKLLIGNIRGSCYSQKSAKRQSLKKSPTHYFILSVFTIIII